MLRRLKVFHGSSNPALAKEICEHLQVKPGQLTIKRFSNGNIKIKVEENVRNADVFVIQTASQPTNEHLVELLILIDALKYASAGRITAVMPNYFYSRSDKKDEPRISITARLITDLLETAGADRILTMTLHSPQIMGFPRIPIDQLLATPILIRHFRQMDLRNAVVAAPDVGSAKASRVFARALDLQMVILDKERLGDREEVVMLNVIGDPRNKDVLLIDDEILSGGSMLEAAKILKEQGAAKIWACCTHGFFSNDALQKFQDSCIEQVVTTNTLPQLEAAKYPKLKVLSVGKLFADAIWAIHKGESVGDLFEKISKEEL
ncbi:MAG: ribose-phosphate pyrophosphokinase [candidate division KSB1 bacterium]|nr:ribose-phosphate pyrophosphokinase [candidate division KSB1 bacterium]MDZ7345384.1 ribose-phosphate pyrophosphokinase [candidate division KSB1 bacterium]